MTFPPLAISAAGFAAGVLVKVGGKWVFRQITKRVDDLADLAPKGLLNGLETFKFKGAVRIDGLRSATHAEITKAFKGTQFTPTNHFIKRLKDVRTDALGIKSFKDLETIFRKGSILDADDGLLAIVHNGMAIIVNPKTGRLVTLTPWK